jgi:hypothetical protein
MQAERPPTPERSRPPPSYNYESTNTSSLNHTSSVRRDANGHGAPPTNKQQQQQRNTQERSVDYPTLAAENSVIDKKQFKQPRPLPAVDTTPMLNDID